LTVKLKRIYDPPGEDDGVRILVERLWPRGVRKGEARIDIWLKDIAPSHELRRWFSHRPERWEEFKRRYWEEIRDKEAFRELVELARRGTVTLVFSARSEYNNAAALKEFIERVLSNRLWL